MVKDGFAIPMVMVAALGYGCSATKHTFTTFHDRRLFMGPIGPPFGMLQGGVFNLTVYDYQMVAINRYEEHMHSAAAKADDDTLESSRDENALLSYRDDPAEDWQISYPPKSSSTTTSDFEFQAAFVLAKFETFADYIQYTNELLEASHVLQSCSFQQNGAKQHGNHFDLESDSMVRHAIVLHTAGSTPTSKPQNLVHAFDKKEEEGEYYLFYQVCVRAKNEAKDSADNERTIGQALEFIHHYRVLSSFELDIALHNTVRGGVSYLAAGDMPLPKLYLFFGLLFAATTVYWIRLVHDKSRTHFRLHQVRPNTQSHSIHYIMFVLLVLKTMSLFLESIRFHVIRNHGHAEFWSALFYVVGFVKSTTLFATLLLIGAGWSFVKPNLSSQEVKLLLVILVLQVINNVALAILSDGNGIIEEGEQSYDDWTALLHFVDILCCLAVLLPLVWQIHSLETAVAAEETKGVVAVSTSRASNGDEELDPFDEQRQSLTAPTTNIVPVEDSLTLEKLKLFRSYYLTVVAYIYVTRIIVYLLQEHLGFRHTWLQALAEQTATMAFYVFTGYTFRPRADNPLLQRGGTASTATIDNAEEGSIEFANTTTTTSSNDDVEVTHHLS